MIKEAMLLEPGVWDSSIDAIMVDRQYQLDSSQIAGGFYHPYNINDENNFIYLETVNIYRDK